LNGKFRWSRLRAVACAVLALALLHAHARAQDATLVGDAHVSSAQPTVNSGTLSNLNVGGVYTALVQFDLGTLPAGTTAAQIAKATLRVYCNRADVPGAVQVQSVGGAWTESGVTFATEPALGAVVQTGQVVGAGEFVTFDVTAAVQGWVSAPSTNFGLALAAPAGSGTVVQFDSKENDETSHEPELEVAMVGSAAGGGTVGPQGPAGPQGIQGEPGATGATGATGAQGPAGPVGPQGPQGLPGVSGTSGGIAYQGSYAPATSYAVGDVVVFQGSSYVSLIAPNVGNAPDSSPTAWGLLAAQGAQGLAGAMGAAGGTGPAGPSGSSGPQGPQGVAGPVGPAGSPGLVYEGTYSSTTNYAVGDVVVFQGSSFVSLAGFNVGQTPGVSPVFWGVLTQQGPAGPTGAQGLPGPTGAAGALGPVGPPGSTGAQGAQGIPGESGAQGIPGATGAQGLQGPAGPQGAAGPVGLNFMGAYSSAVNYALGDGVQFQGAGFVSLIANNLGNTPSLSPQDWSMFAASGAVGATGPQGLQGVPGVNGMNGAAGAAGAMGPAGPQGAPGSPGLVFQGTYSSTVSYVVGDVVVFDGSSFVSLVANNVGQTPGLSAAFWGVLTSQGPQGVAGPTGATGAQGPAGPQGLVGAAGPAGVAGPMGILGPVGPQGLTGATGAVGPAGPQGLPGVAGATGAQGVPGAMGAQGLQGPAGPAGPVGATGPAGANGTNGVNGTPGLMWEGAWSSATSYAVNDAVSFSGTSYLSLEANNLGQRPDLFPADWAVLAQAGSAGAAGAVGATGATGATGAQGPAGPAGATGATGAPGAVGINFRGVWSAATGYSVNDAVTFAGATYLAVMSGNNEEPDLFSAVWAVLAQAGAAGAQGAAATVTVGTVTTLPAGSAATVMNSGTAGAAVLNFGIPQGAAGTSGSGTGSGTSSGSFAAIFHTVSDATVFYSVNTPTASATEAGGAVLAWVPMGCTATQLDVFSQQSGAITVTLRAGAPGALANMPLSCSPTTNGSCTATGSVAIAAGDFIDLQISGASGTAAGVWTSLQCQ
jgi:hypothetical protein